MKDPGKRLHQLEMIGDGDNDCGGRSAVATMSSEFDPESRFPEEASLSLCKAAFALPSPSAAVLRSGAKDTLGRDGPEASGASIDE